MTDPTSNNGIYLDYNATTPLAPEVATSISQALTEAWGNPSSSYISGVKAKSLIQEARECVASCIGATSSSDVIFTSGGTEANNWVMQSCVKYFASRMASGDGNYRSNKPHIVTSTVEHDSILEPLLQLEKSGAIDVTKIEIDESAGNISINDVTKAIRQNTVLVTFIMANNETGTILPIKETGILIRKKEKEFGHKIFFHTDAAQVIGKLVLDVNDLDVDFLTVVGHKFYGPRTGAMFIRNLEANNHLYTPMIWGGGQERGWRAGTENTPMIVGLGCAAKLAWKNIEEYRKAMKESRDYLEQRLMEEFGKENIHFNCKSSKRLPNTCNVSILGHGLQGYNIVKVAKRFSCSTGSACHSDKCEPSKILLKFHIPRDVASNALRFSTGRSTTKEDIDIAVQELVQIISSLKQKN